MQEKITTILAYGAALMCFLVSELVDLVSVGWQFANDNAGAFAVLFGLTTTFINWWYQRRRAHRDCHD